MSGFSPVADDRTRLLILGSMPGVRSLHQSQYYAHPRNAFWPIVSQLFGISADLNYQDRLTSLRDCGVGLWDVLHDCDRKGSLDSNIVRSSEVPNDIPAMLTRCPELVAIGFNGQAARKLFNRHFKNDLGVFTDLRLIDLPSSSPAYASLSVSEKTELWKRSLSFVI